MIQALTDVVTIQHLDADYLAVDQVENHHARVGVEVDTGVARAPPLGRRRRGIESRANIFTTAAPVKYAERGNLLG
jgi:hypothetical protein